MPGKRPKNTTWTLITPGLKLLILLCLTLGASACDRDELDCAKTKDGCGPVETDCHGDENGNASINKCGICVGGNTGKSIKDGMDCTDTCGGTAKEDDCGVCSGGSTNHTANNDMDCNGTCFGTAREDDCGACVEGTTGLTFNHQQDCFGECDGSAFIQCEECVGGNTGTTPQSVDVPPGFPANIQIDPCNPPNCGDGEIQSGEDCDDENTSAGDGCSSFCQAEGCHDESACNQDLTTSIHHQNLCQYEDACGVCGGEGPNLNLDTTCNNFDDDCDGEVDEDYETSSITCGEGACQGQGTRSCVNGEEVESCSENNNDTDIDGVRDCEDNCPQDSNTDQANEDGDEDGDVCDAADCGNTFVEEGEECDDGKNGNNTDVCLETCKVNICGDSHACKDASCATAAGGPGIEECDEGENNGNSNACRSDCTLNPYKVIVHFVADNYFTLYMDGNEEVEGQGINDSGGAGDETHHEKSFWLDSGEHRLAIYNQDTKSFDPSEEHRSVSGIIAKIEIFDRNGNKVKTILSGQNQGNERWRAINFSLTKAEDAILDGQTVTHYDIWNHSPNPSTFTEVKDNFFASDWLDYGLLKTPTICNHTLSEWQRNAEWVRATSALHSTGAQWMTSEPAGRPTSQNAGQGADCHPEDEEEGFPRNTDSWWGGDNFFVFDFELE